ncbi:MAG: site-specific DNA-methyltransferase [Candidatus Parcubacteria bacterium]|nr:site-specific DNA-methyltransferase [Candidatus Parcubacteria bacterium]
MTKNNKKPEAEKLKAEIERLKKELKKKKKYGLVWEEKPEDVVEMCKEKLPVLKEVKNKEIITDKEKPVNLMIEGDNYHVLSVLNYTHAKKVDVIYIDPPYNTGARDWKYNNDYVDGEDSFRHSKWLSFMEKRLRLAKQLLNDTGFLIATIDHNEIFNLGNLCDEIFGEYNRVGIVTIVHNPKGRNLSNFFSANSEFMLVFAKNISKAKFRDIAIDEEIKQTFDLNDSQGSYRLEHFMRARTHTSRKNKPKFWYPIYVSLNLKKITREKKNGYHEVFPITNDGKEMTWKTLPETFDIRNNKRGYFLAQYESGRLQIFHKYREQQVLKNVWIDKKYQSEFHGTNLLKEILGKNSFNYPKSLYAVEDILKITTNVDSIVLDFFAGSGTTGHAVLGLNREDNGNRRFILCTNNENNIATNVCYPRIKKVIEGYKNLKGEKVEGLDGNLKYFKTDFVDAEPTDRNKIKLTQQATEMLCVKKGTFEKVLDQKNFKIFKNTNHYTGIIFDQAAIPTFKKTIKDMKGKFSVYIFSLGDETFDDEFKDIKQNVQLSPIPEAILRVYRRIFK